MRSDYFNPDEMYPVFIILTHGPYSFFPKLIKLVTRGEFTHSAICIDRNFRKIFQLKAEKGIDRSHRVLETGLWVGPYNQPLYRDYDQHCGVYVAWVGKNTYELMKEKLDYYESIKDDVKYDLPAALISVFGIKLKRSNTSFFCSEFVAMILNIDKARTKKLNQFVLPDEFRTEDRFHLIWKGSSKNLNPKKLNELAETSRQEVIARGSYDHYIGALEALKAPTIIRGNPRLNKHLRPIGSLKLNTTDKIRNVVKGREVYMLKSSADAFSKYNTEVHNLFSSIEKCLIEYSKYHNKITNASEQDTGLENVINRIYLKTKAEVEKLEDTGNKLVYSVLGKSPAAIKNRLSHVDVNTDVSKSHFKTALSTLDHMSEVEGRMADYLIDTQHLKNHAEIHNLQLNKLNQKFDNLCTRVGKFDNKYRNYIMLFFFFSNEK